MSTRVISFFGKCFKFTEAMQEQILTDIEYINMQESYSNYSANSLTSEFSDESDIVSEYLTIKLEDENLQIFYKDGLVYFGYKIDSINYNKYDSSEGVNMEILNKIDLDFQNLEVQSLCPEISIQIEQQDPKFYLLYV